MSTLITIKQVLQIHALLLAETGGADGIRDLGRFEAAIETQTQVVFGKEVYSSDYHKAAALIRGIIQDYPFIDGNKRTGMMAGLIYLQLQGYTCNAEKGEIEDFAVKVAVNHVEIDEIAAWLRNSS